MPVYEGSRLFSLKARCLCLYDNFRNPKVNKLHLVDFMFTKSHTRPVFTTLQNKPRSLLYIFRLNF